MFNEAIIEEREQGFSEIQGQMGEANEIFKDLAVLAHGQGVVIGKMPIPCYIKFLFIHSSYFSSHLLKI